MLKMFLIFILNFTCLSYHLHRLWIKPFLHVYYLEAVYRLWSDPPKSSCFSINLIPSISPPMSYPPVSFLFFYFVFSLAYHWEQSEHSRCGHTKTLESSTSTSLGLQVYEYRRELYHRIALAFGGGGGCGFTLQANLVITHYPSPSFSDCCFLDTVAVL